MSSVKFLLAALPLLASCGLAQAQAIATQSVYGAVSATLNITIASPSLASTDNISCTLTVQLQASSFAIETITVPAVVTGKSATCKPVLYYQDLLVPNSAGESLAISYNISVVDANRNSKRTSDVPLETIALPTNGTNTIVTVNTRL